MIWCAKIKDIVPYFQLNIFTEIHVGNTCFLSDLLSLLTPIY